MSSIVGKGSTFTLHLNLPIEPSVSADEQHYQENIIYIDIGANTKKLPLLLVEDYEANVLVAASIFENFGYRYDVARTRQEAPDMYASGKYSVVLMDVEMRLMDGHETTRRIRTAEKEKDLPHQIIIAMTAHALPGDREKCMAAGMDKYIAKPFYPHELQAMLIKYHAKDKAVTAVAKS